MGLLKCNSSHHKCSSYWVSFITRPLCTWGAVIEPRLGCSVREQTELLFHVIISHSPMVDLSCFFSDYAHDLQISFSLWNQLGKYTLSFDFPQPPSHRTMSGFSKYALFKLLHGVLTSGTSEFTSTQNIFSCAFLVAGVLLSQSCQLLRDNGKTINPCVDFTFVLSIFKLDCMLLGLIWWVLAD